MSEQPVNETDVKVPANMIIDYFTIPEELAKELSDLLIKQTVREKLLFQAIGDPKYETIEKMVTEVVTKIEAIKVIITRKYVPGKYNSSKYIWNYDGWEVDKNKVPILMAQ